MIRMVRILGAPVIEPPGKAARTQSHRGALRAEPGPHGADQLVHGGVRLDLEDAPHSHRARYGAPAEVVADQVDDHQVLRRGPSRRSAAPAQRGVLPRGGAARPGALDRPGLGASRPRLIRRNRSGEVLSTAVGPKREQRPERRRAAPAQRSGRPSRGRCRRDAASAMLVRQTSYVSPAAISSWRGRHQVQVAVAVVPQPDAVGRCGRRCPARPRGGLRGGLRGQSAAVARSQRAARPPAGRSVRGASASR